jgi:hypothetical protein
MVRGPQRAFAKVPGLSRALKVLTWALPLGRGTITVQDGDVYVEEIARVSAFGTAGCTLLWWRNLEVLDFVAR